VKKIIIPIFILLSVTSLLSSCTKVINVDLNTKDPAIVIEAIVTDDANVPQTVTLSKSVNFSESNSFPAVSNAVVTISDDAGNNATLVETKPGVYQTTTLGGVQGRTYNLKIVADGKTYTSTCKMPAKVPLDSVKFANAPFGGQDGNKSITPVFMDPVGKGNYYRFELQKRDSISKSIFLINDEIVDGAVNNRPLFESELTLRPGDFIKITMECITKEVNLYFYSMDQSSGGPNSTASPANPVTNIQGAVLGYFSAHTVQTLNVRIP